MSLNSKKIIDLKKSLLEGNIDFFINEIENIDTEVDYIKIKEQKLLTYSFDNRILSKFECLITNLFEKEKLSEELKYLKFIKTYLRSKLDLTQEIKKIISLYFPLDIKISIQEYYIIIDEFLEGLYESSFKKIPESFYNNLNIQEKSNISEIIHNEIRGRFNDTFFAFARLLNILFEEKTIITKKNSPSKIHFVKAFNLAGNLNTYDYVLNNLSYGVWKIKDIQYKKVPIYNFEIKNYAFVKSRSLGLRRMTSDKIRGSKRKSVLKEELLKIGVKALKKAWLFYYKTNSYSHSKKFFQLKKEFKHALNEIDLEDEILIAFSASNKTYSTYIKAIIVLAYLTVKNSSNFGESPILSIKSELKNIYVNNEVVDNDLSFLDVKAPQQDYLKYTYKPFILDDNKNVYQIKYFSTHHWVQNVRDCFMKGGSLANVVGKTWENYIEYLFIKNNWKVLGSSISVKKNSYKLTDIDLLVFNEGILFVFQMKIFYSLDINNFAQWKSRQKLIKASEQLKRVDKSTLEKIIKDKGFNLPIKKIYQIILTNSHIYNGYKFENSIVTSVSSLNQFFNNAQVNFVDINNNTISKKKFMKKTSLNADEFISFIEKPLDWRLAEDKIKVNYIEEEFEHCKLKMPRI